MSDFISTTIHTKNQFAIGDVVGQLRIIDGAPRKRGIVRWTCVCQVCGTITTPHEPTMRACANPGSHCKTCAKRKLQALHKVEWDIWRLMIDRCTRVGNISYPNYGGRGIQVAPEWLSSFDVFLLYVGQRPTPKHTLDRYPNNDGNYEPGNVRWATRIEQGRRTRRNRHITYQGETLVLAEWAIRTGLDAEVISIRLKNSWTVEEALTTPVAKHKPHPGRDRKFTYDGKTLTLRMWSVKIDISYETLSARILKGWSIEETLTTPKYHLRVQS